MTIKLKAEVAKELQSLDETAKRIQYALQKAVKERDDCVKSLLQENGVLPLPKGAQIIFPPDWSEITITQQAGE